MSALLEVEDLEVGFGGRVSAVRGISLSLNPGETHCLVGESGCGKSVTSLAIMNLLARGATRSAKRLALGGQDLLGLSARGMARIAGNRMSMIFQEPMTSLNPAYTVGSQMAEGFLRHRGGRRGDALARAEGLLARCGVSAPGMRLGQFPHQLSGGLRQRVMIAMALMCEPELLIADEPTTALDVTVQAQILRLLAEIQQETGLAILLITHDLGIVARVAHRVSVMYAGHVVEAGETAALFASPEHPYTRGLIGCIPVPGRLRPGELLGSIPGSVPRIGPGFTGCAFRERCAFAERVCETDIQLRGIGPNHSLRCRLEPGWQGDWPPRMTAETAA